MANLRLSSSDSFEKLGVDSMLKENRLDRVGNNVFEPKIKCDQWFCLFRRMFAVLPLKNPSDHLVCLMYLHSSVHTETEHCVRI